VSDTAVVVQAALAGPGQGRGDGLQIPVTRNDGFRVPLTDDEVVEDALAAWDAGAAVIHLRARGPDGAPSGRAEHFAPLVEGIRSAGCDAILSFACGVPGQGGLDCLALRPELASLGCLDDVFGRLAIDDPLPLLRDALATLRDARTAPELQCRHFGHVRTVLGLREQGLLEDPLRVQLVVGEGTSPSPIEHVLQMSSLLPADAVWSVAATGARHLRLNVLSLIAGGHLRTGLEDSHWLVEDVPATNEELVQRLVRVVDELDRPLATPEEAREILQLPVATGPPAPSPHSGRLPVAGVAGRG
jgi:3-keto-5-aminohexanoate cleavage enzyme